MVVLKERRRMALPEIKSKFFFLKINSIAQQQRSPGDSWTSRITACIGVFARFIFASIISEQILKI